MVIASPAQTFTTLKFFNGTNGESPFAPPVEGLDSNLYGTTMYGGRHSYGTVYKLTSSGTFSKLHNFCKVSGCPGWLYGTTWAGGAGNGGTDFRINTNGKLETLNISVSSPIARMKTSHRKLRRLLLRNTRKTGRPAPLESEEFLAYMAARQNAPLCAFEEHAQDGAIRAA